MPATKFFFLLLFLYIRAHVLLAMHNDSLSSWFDSFEARAHFRSLEDQNDEIIIIVTTDKKNNEIRMARSKFRALSTVYDDMSEATKNQSSRFCAGVSREVFLIASFASYINIFKINHKTNLFDMPISQRRQILDDLQKMALKDGFNFLSHDGLLDEVTIKMNIVEIKERLARCLKDASDKENLIEEINKLQHTLFMHALACKNFKEIISDADIASLWPYQLSIEKKNFLRSSVVAQKKVLKFLCDIYIFRRRYPQAQDYFFLFWSEQKTPAPGKVRVLKCENSDSHYLCSYERWNGENQQLAAEAHRAVDIIIEISKKYVQTYRISNSSSNDLFDSLFIVLKLKNSKKWVK
jgi:hypothetical protein